MTDAKFYQAVHDNYQLQANCIELGSGMMANETAKDARIHIPLKTLNRHGLIAGATGTGKTKTIQVLAEQLSAQGVPTLLMDIKGDLSGLAQAGEANDKIMERQQELSLDFKAQGFPCELLSISNEPGLRLRATVAELGPILLAQMLELNKTQTSVLSALFQYAKKENLLLLDLEDLKALLKHAETDGNQAISAEYGNMPPQSITTIFRQVIELESQGGKELFAEPAFEVDDLCRCDQHNKGIISILRLTDVQDRPKLFSAFMLALLADVYSSFPEEGDLDKPKLVMVIDEAHLIFEQASKQLLQKLETIIKLIRSKGVGIIFCTQTPQDIPDAILGQLGLKVQHALRAVTAKDRKAIKLAAENFPPSDLYKLNDLITALGIGEALVTALDRKGRPTPVIATKLRAPESRMGPLSDSELGAIVANSELYEKYKTVVDRQSASEMLAKKMATKVTPEQALERPEQVIKDKSLLNELSKNTMVRQVARTVFRELTRSILKVAKHR